MEESQDTFRFFTRDVDLRDLGPRPWFKRWPLSAWRVFLATAFRLSPARRIAGALYVSCAGRGGPHFGGPSAELQIVRRALGDVPLVGFFAGGEIARHHLYGYTGVLTVFR